VLWGWRFGWGREIYFGLYPKQICRQRGCLFHNIFAFNEQHHAPNARGFMPMTSRLQNVRFIGIQFLEPGNAFPWFDDPETGTSFSISPGESIQAALDKVDERFGVKEPT